MREFSFNAILPWVLVVLMTTYIFGLSYYATHQAPPEPKIDFFGTANVRVEIGPCVPDSAVDFYVSGSCNNLITDSLSWADVRRQGNTFLLSFRVFSPRPANLYLNDQFVPVFLLPDSTLRVQACWDAADYQLDSLSFSGATADICTYYLARNQKFSRRDARRRGRVLDGSGIRAVRKLDSLVQEELAYLLTHSVGGRLPDWFLNFEKNEILYHRAYLRYLSGNDSIAYSVYLDDLPLNNPEAAFSQSYYRYLNARFDAEHNATPSRTAASAASNLARWEQQLAYGFDRLEGEVRDVYLTSLLVRIHEIAPERAQFLLKTYRAELGKSKYVRFLGRKIEGRGPSIAL